MTVPRRTPTVTVRQRKGQVVITLPAPGVAIDEADQWTLFGIFTGLKIRITAHLAAVRAKARARADADITDVADAGSADVRGSK